MTTARDRLIDARCGVSLAACALRDAMYVAATAGGEFPEDIYRLLERLEATARAVELVITEPITGESRVTSAMVDAASDEQVVHIARQLAQAEIPLGEECIAANLLHAAMLKAGRDLPDGIAPALEHLGEALALLQKATDERRAEIDP